MKLRILVILAITFILNSCVSIPKETVQLSQVINKDLKVLQSSHKTMVTLFYKEITNNINDFIEDVYTPFIINYVLKKELESYNKKEHSIIGALEDAGKIGGKAETEKAFNEMTEFLRAANTNIAKKKNELLDPIQKQEAAILLKIDASYKNTMLANLTITNYLESVLKMKESQKEVLSIVGLKGKDTLLNNTLVDMSEFTKSLLAEGREIDIKSNDAYDKMKTISDKIKSITNKK